MMPSSSRHSVVVGFDASPASRTALACAAAWAGRENTCPMHVAVVYVEPMDGMALINAIAAALNLPVTTSHDRHAEAADVFRRGGGPPEGWSFHTPMGSVAEQLTAVADAVDADAIIVGRSRRGLGALRASVGRQLAGRTRRATIVVASRQASLDAAHAQTH
jgi:nucleotide-binding universal stress UspA family protein